MNHSKKCVEAINCGGKMAIVASLFNPFAAIGILRKRFVLLLVFPFKVVRSRHLTQSNRIEIKYFNGGQMCQMLTAHFQYSALHNHFFHRFS